MLLTFSTIILQEQSGMKEFEPISIIVVCWLMKGRGNWQRGPPLRCVNPLQPRRVIHDERISHQGLKAMNVWKDGKKYNEKMRRFNGTASYRLNKPVPVQTGSVTFTSALPSNAASVPVNIGTATIGVHAATTTPSDASNSYSCVIPTVGPAWQLYPLSNAPTSLPSCELPRMQYCHTFKHQRNSFA